jgi:hypothetical protein
MSKLGKNKPNVSILGVLGRICDFFEQSERIR